MIVLWCDISFKYIACTVPRYGNGKELWLFLLYQSILYSCDVVLRRYDGIQVIAASSTLFYCIRETQRWHLFRFFLLCYVACRDTMVHIWNVTRGAMHSSLFDCNSFKWLSYGVWWTWQCDSWRRRNTWRTLFYRNTHAFSALLCTPITDYIHSDVIERRMELYRYLHGPWG